VTNEIIKIDICPLLIAGYREIIDRLKSLLSTAGKKVFKIVCNVCNNVSFQYYVIVVGKLNVAKLANFMEMDLYVVVTCPESSLIDNQVTHFTYSKLI